MCDIAGEIKNPAQSIAPIGTLMNAIGGLVAGNAAAGAGRAQRQAADFRAAQLEQNASNVMGAGQRVSADELLKAKLLASRAIAVAGASGGDVTSPGVSQILSDIAGRGAYNAGIALYNAEEQARQMRISGEAERYSGQVQEAGGKQKQAAYMFGTAGGLAQASSLFAKYGRGGPKSNAPGAITPTDDWMAGGATGNM